MKNNLLLAKKLPERINVIQTDIDDYREMNKIVKGIPKHLEFKKLFFFGDTDEIYQILTDNSSDAEILDPIEVNEQSIYEYWNILRVLFYSAINKFLRGKGFYFHKQLAYMVEFDDFGETPLIREDDWYNYYVHEGFDYKLHLLNQKVFLSLIPHVVLTWDKRGDVISKEEGSKFYTHHWSKRYNSVTRDMLNLWIDFLSDEDGIKIPIPNENSLIFENEFSNASDAKSIKIEKKRQVSLDDYW